MLHLVNTLAVFVFDDVALLVTTIVISAAAAAAQAASQAAAQSAANKAADQTAKNAKAAARIAEISRKEKEAEETAQVGRAFDKARKAQEASASTRNAMGVSSEGLSIALLSEGLAAQRNIELNSDQEKLQNDSRLADILNRANAAKGSTTQAGLMGGFEGLKTGISLGGALSGLKDK